MVDLGNFTEIFVGLLHGCFNDDELDPDGWTNFTIVCNIYKYAGNKQFI